MDMSWCHDCGGSNDWVPALMIALTMAAGVAIGYAAQRISDRLGSRQLGTFVVCLFLAVVAARMWVEAVSLFAFLPLAGVLAGLFHRRQRIQTPFTNRV